MGAGNSKSDIKIVVVGGGYAGTAVASKLMGNHSVQILSASEAMHHSIGSPRSLVSSQYVTGIQIPYTNKFGDSYVHGSVSGVDSASKTVTVTSSTGETRTIAYDYLVIATGAAYSLPAKALSTREQTTAALTGLNESVSKAADVVLLGGGPVGIEMAGEIKAAYPNKNVTIVHSGERLASSATNANGPLPAAFQNRIMAELEKLGVRVILGQKGTVEGDVKASHGVYAGRHTVVLANGEKLSSDVTLQASAGAPNTSFLAGTGFSSALDERGFIRVNDSFQVQGFTDVFAVGDVTARNEAKMAFIASQNVPVVVENIKALIKARAKGQSADGLKLKSKPVATKPLMFITAGPKGGAGVVGKKVMGPFLVKTLKGKDLFLGKTASDLKCKVGKY